MFKYIFLFLIPMSVYAHFDFSTNIGLRSYPALGGEVNLESGYNLVFWGSGPGADKKNPLYGLIRPAVSVGSSAVINNYDARLEFYPLSIIGFVVGKKHIKSDYEDFSFFDCEKIRCMGTIDREYKQFKMALAFGKLITMVNIIESENTYDDVDDEGKPVAEFRFALLANPEEDKMYRSQYLLGYKHSTGLVGIVAEYVEFSMSDQTHNMDILVYTTKSKDTTYVFGMGQFSSTHQARGLIGVFQMKTDFISSSKIF
jgi:hypothetical protein